jgi:hypothetical protein
MSVIRCALVDANKRVGELGLKLRHRLFERVGVHPLHLDAIEIVLATHILHVSPERLVGLAVKDRDLMPLLPILIMEGELPQIALRNIVLLYRPISAFCHVLPPRLGQCIKHRVRRHTSVNATNICDRRRRRRGV